jgi:hypothetical protein
MVVYAEQVREGLDRVSSLGDGYTINIRWYQAYPSTFGNAIAYNIYYAEVKGIYLTSVIPNIYSEGVKYVSIDGSLEANIIDLTPGQEYYFSIRPVEYDPTQFNLNNLPIAYDNLRVLPQSVLSQDINATQLNITLDDVSTFTSSGIVKIGGELIQYSSVDTENSQLIVYSSTSPPSNAYLVPYPGGSLYFAAAYNIGNGIFNQISLFTTATPATIWRIYCIGLAKDNFGNTIPGSERFAAFGADGDRGTTDQFGNPQIWLADGILRNNGVLSFSISEGSIPFALNDMFDITVGGSQTGTNITGRGYDNTTALGHTISGFDGYQQWSPTVEQFILGETSIFDRIFACQSRFEYPNFARTNLGGYKQITTDILSTDLSSSYDANIDFPAYDYAGWHRTDPTQLLAGVCVGSYIFGEQGCIDGYGNYNIIRGQSLQDQNNQRQEMELSMTGRPATLIIREQTGIVCSCYLASSEYQDDRCPYCHSTKFVLGYRQYFNPRRSDGRIMVRPSATEEILKMTEAGLESDFPQTFWTLTVPTIKTRDIIVLYELDNPDQEEFRYEVGAVSRNIIVLAGNGAQTFKTYRIRKTDPAYQVRIINDTAMFPSKLATTMGMAVPNIGPHVHDIVINEKVTSVSQINQETSKSQGHSHQIINGVVMPVLGHDHQIILP